MKECKIPEGYFLRFSLIIYMYQFRLIYFLIRENFENLLDDAKFKTEIVLFSIDQENSILSEEHRAQVLPILMRYGVVNCVLHND